MHLQESPFAVGQLSTESGVLFMIHNFGCVSLFLNHITYTRMLLVEAKIKLGPDGLMQ